MGGLIAKIITKRIILKSHSQSAKCMDHHSWRLFLGIEPQPQNSLCASQPSPESNWILFLVLTRTANSFSVHCITVLLSNVFKCIISPKIQALTGSLPTPRYRGANSRGTSTHFPRQKSGYHLPSVGAPLQVPLGLLATLQLENWAPAGCRALAAEVTSGKKYKLQRVSFKIFKSSVTVDSSFHSVWIKISFRLKSVA